MNHVFSLEKPKDHDEKEFVEMMRVWHLTRTKINPKLLRFYHDDFHRWIEIIERHRKGLIRGSELPQSLYFLKCDNTLVGAVSVREKIHFHEVKGHISYGIHPAFRKKGFGKIALKLALMKTREEFGISSVQVICNADNDYSKRIMESCGGVFVRHTYKNQSLVNVYYFDMDKLFLSSKGHDSDFIM